MGWRVYADSYDTTGEITDASKYSPIIPSRNIILLAVRTWVVFVGDPVYTSLSMKIYSNDENDMPLKLLHTSTDVRLPTELDPNSDGNGCREVYFTFAKVPLKAGDRYNFVLNASGYNSPSAESHIAWRKGFPDPVYPDDGTMQLVSVGKKPGWIYCIGANL